MSSISSYGRREPRTGVTVWATLIVAVLLMSGCGGGGGNAPAPPPVDSARSWDDRPFMEASLDVRRRLDVFAFPDNPELPYPSGPPVSDAQARALLEQTARSQGADYAALLSLYDGSRPAFPGSVPLTQLTPAQDYDLRAALAVLSLTEEGALALRALTTAGNSSGQPWCGASFMSLLFPALRRALS